jgi:cyclophilin family peptidyl-prolyl cis-trans isomerase
MDPGIPVANEVNPCLPFSIVDVLLATPFPGLPPVTSDDWAVGPEDAAVTFMEYSELQCPFCAQFEPIIVAFQEQYPDDVRIVFRHRPFVETFHDKSILGAQALEAAGKQGKFNEFKNFMFERQAKNPNNPAVSDLPDEEFWAGVSPDLFDEWMAERVPELGINADQFIEDMFSAEIVEIITQKMDEADSLGISGTPTLLINGYLWPEQQRGIELFSIYTELILGQEKEYDTCPRMEIVEGKEYSAVISTTKGDIEVDLFADQAPYAVNSFVFLAREGWYENMGFFITDEFAMSGDPTETGFGGSGYIFLDEVNEDLNFTEAGMLSTYARLGPGLNTSTFFISRIPLTGQDDRSIFGKVTAGLDVLDQLTLLQDAAQSDLDRVLSITITEK